MNDAAFCQIDAWGMAYASDGRGTGPFIPIVDGDRSRTCSCRRRCLPSTS